MAEITFDDYAYHAWTTAYYLDEEPKTQATIIRGGYYEEISELLTDEEYPLELTSKLWGLPIDKDVSAKLDSDKTSEAGDVLYFITAAGAMRGIQLREIARSAMHKYLGDVPVTTNDTLVDFDNRLANLMGPAVPSEYRPNYHTWKMWDFAPFESGLHIVLRNPQESKGPLRLIPDGRYALERLCSALGTFLLPEVSNDEEFLAAAGLALGGISVVLQSRFNSSLRMAALRNIEKRERRQENGLLKDGVDAERSRRMGQERVQPTHEEAVSNNLLNAPLPPPTT